MNGCPSFTAPALHLTSTYYLPMLKNMPERSNQRKKSHSTRPAQSLPGTGPLCTQAPSHIVTADQSARQVPAPAGLAPCVPPHSTSPHSMAYQLIVGLRARFRPHLLPSSPSEPARARRSFHARLSANAANLIEPRRLLSKSLGRSLRLDPHQSPPSASSHLLQPPTLTSSHPILKEE